MKVAYFHSYWTKKCEVNDVEKGMRVERLDRTLTHIVIIFLLSVFGKLMLQQFWKINRIRDVLEKNEVLQTSNVH